MAWRMELTQSKIRFMILGAFVAALLVFLSNSDAVRNHPALDKVKAPWGEAAPPPPPPGPPERQPPPGPPPKTTTQNATAPLSLDEAKQFCDFRRFKPWPNRKKNRKVFDLILVNRELEWLEIRLGQMYSHVDYFVIVESDKSFTDKPKTLYVKENWDRFAAYHDKMIRHTLTVDGMEFGSTWEREGYSRNAMVNQVLPFLEGEKKVELGDVLIIADVDEIPRPDTLVALRNCEIPDAITLRSRMYYYSFQWQGRIEGEWPHPQAMLWKGKDTMPADDLRGGYGDQPSMFNAAWHCSYCFPTLADLINKVTSFSHTEFNKPEFRDPVKILNRVRSGLDFFDRGDSIFDRVEDNPDVPGYLKKNAKTYAFALNRDPPNGNFQDEAK